MSFKQNVKNVGSRAKNSVKKVATNYRDDLDKAFTLGYQSGWNDAYKIPNRTGALMFASVGYGRGVKNRQRSDLYNRRYNKYR